MKQAGFVVAAIAAVGVLGACSDFTGGTTAICRTQAPVVTAMRGDTAVTNIGLRYVETRPGTGDSAQVCRQVTADFTAYVAGRDSAFDSSLSGTPLTFVAGGGAIRVVGIDVGVVGMKVGGQRRLIIPPELAFGSVEQVDRNGKVVVPANSTLVVDLQLRSVGPVTP